MTPLVRRASRFLCIASVILTAGLADDKASDTSSVRIVLQENDEIAVHSLQVKEVAEKGFRVDQNGEVHFPLAGVLKVGGHTPREAEGILAEALKAYYLDPDINISVTSFHIETLSVLGSVGTPGVYPIRNNSMSLLEAISAAGGLRGDAGPFALVTRQGVAGAIPHPDARTLVSGESIVQIDLHSLMSGQNSTDNFKVKPHDVVSINAAQFVYVVGSVRRSGGFPLGGRPNLSVIQVLALTEGFDPRAAPAKALIIRHGSTLDQRVPVNMKKILDGKAEDVVLRPDDILFIPTDKMKTVTNRMLETAIQIGTGLAIFRP